MLRGKTAGETKRKRERETRRVNKDKVGREGGGKTGGSVTHSIKRERERRVYKSSE